MRHETAVHVTIDGVDGWHYASVSRRGGYPLGRCGEHPPHQTQAEARECYAAYQRERIRLDATTSNWCDCEECGAPTKTGARIEGDGYALVMLCGEHLTVEAATRALHLDRPAGDAWVS